MGVMTQFHLPPAEVAIWSVGDPDDRVEVAANYFHFADPWPGFWEEFSHEILEEKVTFIVTDTLKMSFFLSHSW
jgi:hypothetical protein